MANDPYEMPDSETETVIDLDNDTVLDPHGDPYDEAFEKPLKDSENFISSEEL